MEIFDSSVHVLLIEDDIVDILHIEHGFRKYNIKNSIDITNSGADALEKIYGTNPIATPKVIILDINMPKINGFEFLRKLKLDVRFKDIPVIIVTTSNAYRDMEMARSLNVSGYFTKPLKFEQFIPLYTQIIKEAN